tara:strand:- start:5183 stop:5602 length:420 start_codon:yes stop_codon:yes gene_type:complete
MAYDNTGGSTIVSFEAAGDLSSSQYKLVKLDANGKVVIVAATTDIPVGVLQNAPASGSTASVLVCGVSKVSADAAINEGVMLKTSADGQVTTISMDAALAASEALTPTLCIGVAYTAAGGAAELITAGINCLNPSMTYE